MKTDKPIRCSYSMAMYNTNIPDSVFQRGSYFVRDMTKTKDKYRYACYFMDSAKDIHLLGSVGNIDSAKRFCNSIYHAYPFQDNLKNLEYEKLVKKYKLKSRTENKPKQAPKQQAPKTPAPKTPAPAPKQQAPKAPKTPAPKQQTQLGLF